MFALLFKDILRPVKRRIRSYLTTSGRQERFRLSKLEDRSMARKILLDFVGEGSIASVIFQRDGSIITMTDGRRFWWDPGDNVQRLFTVSYQGDFEVKETKFARSVLSSGNVALDIGANFGWYTLLFSQLVETSGWVHAFEPIPRNFKVLHANCKLNQADHVILNNFAVGAKSGERHLFLPDIGSSGAFQLHKYQKAFETFSCKVSTLDEYVTNSNISQIDLIKADIEGAELEMLHGASNVLQMSPKPIWLMEIQEKSCSLYGYSPQEVFDLMKRYGYSPYLISPAGKLQHLKETKGFLSGDNFVFVHSSRELSFRELE